MAGSKFQIGNVSLYIAEKGLFLSLYVNDIKLAGKKQNLDIRCGKYSIKKSSWENEHLSLITYTWAALNDNCQTSKDTVDNYRIMFESRISAVGVEKLPFPQNLRISSWSYDMAGHLKKYVERYCELGEQDDSATQQSIYSMHR